MNKKLSILLTSFGAITFSTFLVSFSPDTLYLRKIKDHNDALSEPFLHQLKRLFRISALIESGTYIGDTAEVASRVFAVHSIELSRQLYLRAQKRFSQNKNIHLYFGDSTEVLPQILPSLKNECLLFWLDGHWSAGVTAKGATNTPIMQELKDIQKSGITNAIILVDDIRFFQRPINSTLGTSAEGYPELKDLINEIQQISNHYQCLVLGDVLLAYPDTYQINSSPIIKACTISRLFDGKNFDISEVLTAEAMIANARDEELETLQWLSSQKFTFIPDGEFGLGRYYFLWNGLSQLRKNPSQAFQFFNRAIATGCNHERVHIYRAYAAKMAGSSQNPLTALSPDLTQKVFTLFQSTLK